jgi:hypothetical protein
MADAEPVGSPWSDDELDAIVADYFAMLGAELRSEPYVKSQHNAELVRRLRRSRSSVEFKHQNISAVLEEMELPRIRGYQPMRNYQNAIFGAIDRYLSFNGPPQPEISEPAAPWISAIQETFVAAPALIEPNDRPPALERLIRKFDPAERDAMNRSLGLAGERFVLALEREQLLQAQRADLAERVRWVSKEDGDGSGFDIRSFDPSGKDRLIEVKTTNGSAHTPFFLSRNELDVANAQADRWHLYRVHLFAQTPRVFELRPPLDQVLNLRTETWRATFG